MSRTCSGVTSSICCFASSIRSSPVLNVIRSTRVRCDIPRAGIAAERRHCTERNRPFLRDVAYRNPNHAWNPELAHNLAQYFVERSPATTGIVGTFHALAEGDCLTAAQHSRKLELLQHPIDAINRLVDVLEDENGIGEIGCVSGPAKRGQHSEISAGKASFRFSAGDSSRLLRFAARIGLCDDCALQR